MAHYYVLAVAALLFVISFVTKRRFGVLGLGLAAGVIIASQFNRWLTHLFNTQAFSFTPFSDHDMAMIILVMAPAIILLAGGPRYQSHKAALLGSAAFIVLAFVLLIEPLAGNIDWLQQTIPDIVKFFSANQGLIAAIGVVVAIGDMFLSHNPHLKIPKSKSR
ncbi:MAG TPA: hypothetical protein VFK03_01655 [Candidatus Saccharimonadales bacterium]|nr:hypothetical protein [Candidatus Saccharimonadales bacterium]